MLEHVLAFGHPHGAASMMGTGSYWAAIGILIGFAVASFAPVWVRAAVIVFDLVALGWMSGILGYADRSKGHWVWFAIVFLGIGLFLGVARGLRFLSEYEFSTRLRNIRGEGHFF
jgi:hypothetical protein